MSGRSVVSVVLYACLSLSLTHSLSLLSARPPSGPFSRYVCSQVLKETLQVNYDPFDEEEKLVVTARNQDVSSALCTYVKKGSGDRWKRTRGVTGGTQEGHTGFHGSCNVIANVTISVQIEVQVEVEVERFKLRLR